MFEPPKFPTVGGAALALCLAGSLLVTKPAPMPMPHMSMGQLLTRAPLNPVKVVQVAAQQTTSWQQYVNSEQKLLHQTKQRVATSQSTTVADAVVTPKPKTAAKAPSAKVAAVQREAAKLKKKVQVASRSASSDKSLLGFALSLTGIPYQYGGTTTNGFDCSAYTRYVYAHFGVSLPRTSYDQYHAGSGVSKSNLEPGDLVFFTTYQSGPSHVGIYVGNGNFVHASNSGVRVNSMGGYYANRFVGARRVR